MMTESDFFIIRFSHEHPHRPALHGRPFQPHMASWCHASWRRPETSSGLGTFVHLSKASELPELGSGRALGVDRA